MNCTNVARIQSDKSFSEDVQFVAAVDPQPKYSNPMIENIETSLMTSGMLLKEYIDEIDLKSAFPEDVPKYILDFSSESGCVKGVTKALEHGFNVISGTTPISKKSESLIKRKIIEAEVKGIR